MLSRAQVLILRRLDAAALEQSARTRRGGHGAPPARYDAAAREALIQSADGDGRFLLNQAETLWSVDLPDPLDPAGLSAFLQRRVAVYDKDREGHYNLISALHKSIRGSDPQAALYYLARMLTAGEEPLFLLRRLTRAAVEDIGLADPNALVQCIAAKDTYDFLGSPEGELAIAQACLYLATAPKSNAVYKAQKAAWKRAKETGSLMPPDNILNAADQADEADRLRQGLCVRPRRRGRIQRRELLARRNGAATLLRTHRPRLREAPRRTPGLVGRAAAQQPNDKFRHSRAGGNPLLQRRARRAIVAITWIPASAGMTEVWMRRIAGPIPALIALPAAAQPAPQPTPYDRAIAAGYKALTLCSAIFVAGRTQAQAEALELTGIYPEYDKLVPRLPAQVDRDGRAVQVPFGTDLPPRRAEWREGPGCTIKPIGYVAPQTAAKVATPPGPVRGDPRRWPLGDSGFTPNPAAPLAAAVDAAFTPTGPRTTGVLIVSNNRILAERYADGFDLFTANRTWSVAKSLTGTLIGVAVQQGWSTPPPRRTCPNGSIATTLAAPSRSTISSICPPACTAPPPATAPTRSISAAPLSPRKPWPGRSRPNPAPASATPTTTCCWRCARCARRSATSVTQPSRTTRLFAPLGMRHTVAETDWRGNFILSSQVWSTARDLARFGLLYLNDGVWNGQAHPAHRLGEIRRHPVRPPTRGPRRGVWRELLAAQPVARRARRYLRGSRAIAASSS